MSARFLLSLKDRERLIVAAGGGATLLDDSRQAIVESGLVVCLEATPPTIVARLTAVGEERPLLADASPLARVRARLKSAARVSVRAR